MKFTYEDETQAKDFDDLKRIMSINSQRKHSVIGKALGSCDEQACEISVMVNLA